MEISMLDISVIQSPGETPVTMLPLRGDLKVNLIITRLGFRDAFPLIFSLCL